MNNINAAVCWTGLHVREMSSRPCRKLPVGVIRMSVQGRVSETSCGSFLLFHHKFSKEEKLDIYGKFEHNYTADLWCCWE